MALLLGDEDFPDDVCANLIQLGHGVETINGLKLKAIGDPLVLSLATAAGRAVLTQNKWDFIALHKTGVRHAGIIVCTRDDDFAALAHRIHLAIEQHGDLRGKLIRVNKPA